MSGNKVTFGVTSKGKPLVVHKQYEFVKHRKYASGNIQWRCKLYQSSKYQARLTTKNDEIISNCDTEHNITILVRRKIFWPAKPLLKWKIK